jgi:dienelactone hydrolase
VVDEETRFAACEAIMQLIDMSRGVYIWGRSMGASLAMRISAEYDVDGIVFEAPLASVRTFISQSKPRVAKAFEYIQTDAYSTISYAPMNKLAPIYILYMQNDGVLTPKHSELIEQKLIESGCEFVYRIRVDGKRHNSYIDEYTPYVPISFFHPTSFAPITISDDGRSIL